MEPELEKQLENTSKETLLQLLHKLATRHPVLVTEMANILQNLTGNNSMPDEAEEEITEDWDFSGDERVTLRQFPRPTILPVDNDMYRKRVSAFATRLSQGEEPRVIFEDVLNLLEEAEQRSEQRDFYGALDIYELVLDERLREASAALTPLLDDAIDAVMPSLEALLSEASSNSMPDTSNVSLLPLLAPHVRYLWLERLFTLWLKRLDAHLEEEELPEIIVEIAWSDDIALLRTLVQNELQRQSPDEHSNIVDITHQYRTRALEKFIKDLPWT